MLARAETPWIWPRDGPLGSDGGGSLQTVMAPADVIHGKVREVGEMCLLPAKVAFHTLPGAAEVRIPSRFVWLHNSFRLMMNAHPNALSPSWARSGLLWAAVAQEAEGLVWPTGRLLVPISRLSRRPTLSRAPSPSLRPTRWLSPVMAATAVAKGFCL